MKSVQALLFDFDGTLVDASAAICQAFRSVLAQQRLPLLTDDDIRIMIGRPLHDMLISAGVAAEEERLASCIVAYREAFWPLALSLSRALPGVAESLEELADGRKLGIVTTRISEGAERILGRLGLRSYFSTIVGLEQVSRPKPAPEPVWLGLERLRTKACDALMVGDTPDDMGAAVAAGVRAVGVTTGAYGARALKEAGADLVVSGLPELATLLRGERRRAVAGARG